MAAALREILRNEPVIVGGTAEDLYTADKYHETDLDVCGWLTLDEEHTLTQLGFVKQGRHWFHLASKVAVEFPESRIQGDEARIVRESISSGQYAVISREDLYLDRIRQPTGDLSPSESTFASPLNIAAAAFDRIDWVYVERELRRTERIDPSLGKRMRRIDSRVRRQLKRVL